jgi:RNase P/RNase MRP subunit p30
MNDFVFVSESDFQKARNEIRKARLGGKKIVFCGNDETNRKVLEKENPDVLLLKVAGRKDRLKQRNSGFNHVLAKLAKKKGTAIGICLEEIIGAGADRKEKAKILARIMQNINLCKKNRLKMVFMYNQHPRDIYALKALGLVLGMPTWMTKGL